MRFEAAILIMSVSLTLTLAKPTTDPKESLKITSDETQQVAEERADGGMLGLGGGGGGFSQILSLFGGGGGVQGEVLRLLLFPFNVDSVGNGIFGGGGNPFPNIPVHGPGHGAFGGFGG